MFLERPRGLHFWGVLIIALAHCCEAIEPSDYVVNHKTVL